MGGAAQMAPQMAMMEEMMAAAAAGGEHVDRGQLDAMEERLIE